MSTRCLLCPEPPEDGHHVTATDARGSYLDPEFRGGLCHSCHELAGDDINTVGTPPGASSDTFLCSLELRLARSAAFVGRVAQAAPEPLDSFLAWLATHLARWTSRLHASITALDENAPGWRAIPGV
jgi:hypothetical protein